MAQTNPSLRRDLVAAGVGACAGVVGAMVAGFLIAERITSWLGRRLV